VVEQSRSQQEEQLCLFALTATLLYQAISIPDKAD